VATYPSIGLQHSISPATTRRVDISDAGTIRSVDLGETTVYRIRLTHPILNSTDRDTLIAFYAANKNAVNEITLAGSTYDVHFIGDYEVESISAAYFNLSVELVGTKQ
jgi:hypothetical protein